MPTDKNAATRILNDYIADAMRPLKAPAPQPVPAPNDPNGVYAIAAAMKNELKLPKPGGLWIAWRYHRANRRRLLSWRVAIVRSCVARTERAFTD
jgi:hypothetical protein